MHSHNNLCAFCAFSRQFRSTSACLIWFDLVGFTWIRLNPSPSAAGGEGEPLMAILALFACRLANPLLEWRLRKIIVVNPALVHCVVSRVNRDALDSPRVRRQKTLQRHQFVACNDQIALQRRPLAGREFSVHFQRVMQNHLMVTLHRRLPFKPNDRHRLTVGRPDRIFKPKTRNKPIKKVKGATPLCLRRASCREYAKFDPPSELHPH
jgi:hypothetical protein